MRAAEPQDALPACLGRAIRGADAADHDADRFHDPVWDAGRQGQISSM
jgi:hypothetical protein